MYSLAIRHQASTMCCQDNIQYCPTASSQTMILIFAAPSGLRRSSPLLSLTSSSSRRRIWPWSLFFVPLEPTEWQEYLLVVSLVPNFELTILALCWIIAFPLVLGLVLIGSTELGAEINGQFWGGLTGSCHSVRHDERNWPQNKKSYKKKPGPTYCFFRISRLPTCMY